MVANLKLILDVPDDDMSIFTTRCNIVGTRALADDLHQRKARYLCNPIF